ncbi:MAG: inositol monophosphatase [bacterium]|nr:inositol monophosphatase [bacterium]MCP4965760.1 inositol monophosphatase [bacterium]
MNDLELAIAAAAQGAEIVRNGFGSHRVVEQKGRLDPVTEVDRASEEAIVDLLTTHRPDDGLLGEEGSSRKSAGRRWIIDPLDGTVNFVHGIPNVGVSVALYDGNTPLVGVVHDPLRDEVFAASAGGGTTCNGEPIKVSAVAELHKSVMVTGFPYDHDKHGASYATVLGTVLEQVNGIRRSGSAALDFGWLAAGRFDGYWEFSLGAWDMAAGVLLVTEAGGLVTDAQGRTAIPGVRHLVAANPYLHEKLRRIVEPIIPEHILS